MTLNQSCKGCGCTNNRACPGGCHWVKPGLCSVCHEIGLVKLADEAADWIDTRNEVRFSDGGMLGGFPCQIGVDPGPILTVKDHLGIVAFGLAPDGVYLAPQYEADEVLKLFAAEDPQRAVA